MRATTRAADLTRAWADFEEAVMWQPFIPLFSVFGFCWQRSWDRPFVPDLEAVPAAEREYYARHGCFQFNNPGLNDLGKDVLFDLITRESGAKMAADMDREVLPRMRKLIERLAPTAATEPVFRDLRDRADLLIDPSLPVGSLAATQLLGAVAVWRSERATRASIVSAFGKYLSPTVVDRLAENPDLLTLGGETREGPLTVGLTYHNTAIYEIVPAGHKGWIGPRRYQDEIPQRALGLTGDAAAVPAIAKMASGILASGALSPLPSDTLDAARDSAPAAFRLAIYALTRLKAYDALAGVVLDPAGQPRVRKRHRHRPGGPAAVLVGLALSVLRLPTLVAHALGAHDLHASAHRLDRGHQVGIGLEPEARDEAGRPHHAERIVGEGELRGLRGAEPSVHEEVLEAAVGVDEHRVVPDLDGHRVHGEVTAHEVRLHVVGERHLGLAALRAVDVAAERRHLEVAAPHPHAHRAERPALEPDRLRDRFEGAFDLVGAGRGREVEVAEVALRERVAHRAAHEVGPVPGRGEPRRDHAGRRVGREDGGEPRRDAVHASIVAGIAGATRNRQRAGWGDAGLDASARCALARSEASILSRRPCEFVEVLSASRRDTAPCS